MKILKSRSVLLVSSLLLLSVLSACASQPLSGPGNPAGFFLGLFHGFTILFSLLASFFTDVRIYTFPNAGLWYDLGYFIGASAFLGGGSVSARCTGREKVISRE